MSGGHSSSGIGGAIKKGVGMVHGTGEAIRGNFNAAVDQAGGDRIGVEKNTAIASNGANEIEHGYHQTGHGAGVTPVDAERERLNTTQTTSTNYGSHSTNTANKLDPRFDSDLDHRGTATGSTNVGHHSSNLANKLDPRIDTDADHRANPNSCCARPFYSQTDGTGPTTTPYDGDCERPTHSGFNHKDSEQHDCHDQHIHRGSISGGTNLEAAQKLDPILSAEDDVTHSDQVNAKTAIEVDSEVGPDAVRCSHPRDESDVNSQTGVSTCIRRVTEPHRPNEPRDVSRPNSEDGKRLAKPLMESQKQLNELRLLAEPRMGDFLQLLDGRINRGDAK